MLLKCFHRQNLQKYFQNFNLMYLISVVSFALDVLGSYKPNQQKSRILGQTKPSQQHICTATVTSTVPNNAKVRKMTFRYFLLLLAISSKLVWPCLTVQRLILILKHLKHRFLSCYLKLQKGGNFKHGPL